MKKLTSVVAASMCALIMLATPLSVYALKVNTTATDQSTATAAIMQQPEVTKSAQVNYELPYPGMLPDSPLYFLKQIRDWILDKLIMDPVKKAEFYILQADKRLVMGTTLDQAGKNVLGEQVISKGEKYMNNAMQTLLGLKSAGKDVPADTVDHLSQALGKHAEVITSEIAKAQGSEKVGLTSSLMLVQELQADLGKLK